MKLNPCLSSVISRNYTRVYNNTKLPLILMFHFWRFREREWRTPSLTLLPGPLWSGVIVHARIPSVDQIDLFENYFNRCLLELFKSQISKYIIIYAHLLPLNHFSYSFITPQWNIIITFCWVVTYLALLGVILVNIKKQNIIYIYIMFVVHENLYWQIRSEIIGNKGETILKQ